MNEQQSFANHAKFVPAFHFFAGPVLIANLIWAVVQSVHVLLSGHLNSWLVVGVVFHVLVAGALVVTVFLARIFALGVQDRVIRLEERLRYQQALSEDLKPRIGEFTINQLVSLRFASDEELPALARKVLDGRINDRRTIKRMIQNWRADYQRI